MDINDEQLHAIAQWAEMNPVVEGVHLFGSRVRGTARADSDLDVAVDLGFSERVLQTLIIHKAGWETELRDATGLTVNLDLYHPEMAPHVYGYVADCGFLAFTRR